MLLTTGERDPELGAAIRSIRLADDASEIVVVVNATSAGSAADAADAAGADSVVTPGSNLGIPAGRDVGLGSTDADVVFFLDDDARVAEGDVAAVREMFERIPDLGAVSFRLVDEEGRTSRRHVPRFGSRGVDRGGSVATFLGGACAVRASAYRAVGGYWGDLWYGHEELDLSWRLVDAGWSIRYEPSVRVFHPRSEISRHDEGWFRTGRNRVWVGRRNLPRPLSLVHTGGWLVVGVLRAPDRRTPRAYGSGWWCGWRTKIERRPMSWRTAVALTRLGRPPVL
ncbi:MAG: hypothetical protein RLZZ01_32 [Actinomycetota bacterium]